MPAGAPYAIALAVAVILFLVVMFTTGTNVSNTEVGIVVNNVTGSKTIYQNGGMIFHLPLGLTTVYKIDKSQRVMYLTQTPRGTGDDAGDQINIKTNDGSNVEIDVEVVYQVKAAMAAEALRELGDEKNVEDILKAMTRSEVRDSFGLLSTLEIAEAGQRVPKLAVIQRTLQSQLDPLGIEVVSINAQNFRFDPEYETIIRERKEADQILANQGDYQAAAEEERNRMKAESERDKETSLAQVRGEMAKLLLIAKGDAQRVLTKAQQEAYSLEREGEIALATADQEAVAIRAEGVQKAEAMSKLLAAYEKGGEGLVKEAVAKFYEGVVVRARPYSQTDRIDRFQTVSVQPGPVAPAQAQPAAPQAGKKQ
jgi:regulator of protease activity HflC (stomatin/prohibitin superfamily)